MLPINALAVTIAFLARSRLHGSDPVALRTWSANPFIELSRLVVLLSRFHTG